MSETKHISLKNLQAFLKPLMRMINRKAESWEDLKNRPFGSEYKQTDLVSNVSCTIDNDGGYEEISNNIYFNAGQTYTVIYDGTQYECVAWRMDSDCVCIGNGDIYGGSGMGNGEPFMCDSYRGGACYVNVQFAGTHTISISGFSEIITKLPDKYCPEIAVKDVVKCVRQNLTDEQKYIVRNNIDAIDEHDLQYALNTKMSLDNLRIEQRYVYSIRYCNEMFFAEVNNETGYNIPTNSILYSYNGFDWNFIDLQLSSKPRCACYGADKYILVSDQDIVYSVDGNEWSVVPNAMPLAYARRICYGNEKFVAINYYSNPYALAYSTDGITWLEAHVHDIDSFHDLCYGNGRFVAINPYRGIAYSDDGIEWTYIYNTTLNLHSICYGENGVYVATSYNNIWYSTDGISWTNANADLSNSTAICYANGQFIVFDENKTLHSQDGINWKSYAHNLNCSSNATICYGNGKYIATNYPHYLVSYDGIHWMTGYLKQEGIEDYHLQKTLFAYLAPELAEQFATTDDVQDASAQIEARISEHNINNTAHTDIRESINELSILVGDVSVSEQISTSISAILPKMTTVTLSAANWTGDANPWSQVVTMNGVTANSKIDLQPTAMQIVDMQNNDVALMAENDNGTVTIYAIGSKPTTDYTMQALITEVAVV